MFNAQSGGSMEPPEVDWRCRNQNTSVDFPAKHPMSTPLPLVSLPPLLPVDYYVGEGGGWYPYSRSCRRLGFMPRNKEEHESEVRTLAQSIDEAKEMCLRLVSNRGPVAELAKTQTLNFVKLMADLSDLEGQSQKRPASAPPQQTEEPPSKRLHFVSTSVSSGQSSIPMQAAVIPRLLNPAGMNRCYANSCVQLMLCFENDFWRSIETQIENRAGNSVMTELLKLRHRDGQRRQPNERPIGNTWNLIKAICEASAAENRRPLPFMDTSRQHDSSELFQKIFEFLPEECVAMLRMKIHAMKTCSVCSNKNETVDYCIRCAILTQNAPTMSLQSIMPEYPKTEPTQENCIIKCNGNTNQMVEESLLVPTGTTYCLMEYYRHSHSDRSVAGLQFKFCPETITHGICEQSGDPVGWSPIGAVCKTGSQHEGHFWAHRLLGNEWLKVNDDDEALPTCSNLALFCTDINLILFKRVTRAEVCSEQQRTVNQTSVSRQSPSVRSLFQTPNPVQRPSQPTVPIPKALITPNTIRQSDRTRTRSSASSVARAELPIYSLQPLTEAAIIGTPLFTPAPDPTTPPVALNQAETVHDLFPIDPNQGLYFDLLRRRAIQKIETGHPLRPKYQCLADRRCRYSPEFRSSWSGESTPEKVAVPLHRPDFHHSCDHDRPLHLQLQNLVLQLILVLFILKKEWYPQNGKGKGASRYEVMTRYQDIYDDQELNPRLRSLLLPPVVLQQRAMLEFIQGQRRFENRKNSKDDRPKDKTSVQ